MVSIVMHILSVAGINYNDSISFDNVGKIPFVSISHVVTSPTCYGGHSTWQGMLNFIDGVNRIINVFKHLLLRVSVPIF